MNNPYQRQPKSAFWSRAVRDPDLSGIWTPKARIDRRLDRFVSAGSCFSNHIGRFLLQQGFTWLSDANDEGRHPGSHASFELDTAKQLLFWLEAAVRPDEVPLDAGVFDDPASSLVIDLLRLGIAKPEFASVDELLGARRRACDGIRNLLGEATVFCFTLGLTEGWETSEGVPYPICPAARFPGLDPESYRFVNYGHDEVWRDVERIVALLAAVNPELRLILTVSPVPLMATATDRHVVPATIYSKSVLRAVAERAARSFEQVDYFPSYELITTHIHCRDFFAADRREVTPQGVDYVMRHFLAGVKPDSLFSNTGGGDVLVSGKDICEEELYDADTRTVPYMPGKSSLLLLGSSQIREVSKKLQGPHLTFTMNGTDFARGSFDEGADIIFRPTVDVFARKWQIFLENFDISDIKAGRCTVVTDIGCHSPWWNQEVSEVARAFISTASDDPRKYSQNQLRIIFKERRAKHLALLRTLTVYGNRVIWVADPHFVWTNSELAEEVLVNLVFLSGVRHIIRPRHLNFDRDKNIIADDRLHGTSYYYDVIAEQVSHLIEI